MRISDAIQHQYKQRQLSPGSLQVPQESVQREHQARSLA